MYCFDCEGPIQEDEDGTFCTSCRQHREDPHEPRIHPADGEDAGFCHGAGPDGINTLRMDLFPRRLREDETDSYLEGYTSR